MQNGLKFCDSYHCLCSTVVLHIYFVDKSDGVRLFFLQETLVLLGQRLGQRSNVWHHLFLKVLLRLSAENPQTWKHFPLLTTWQNSKTHTHTRTQWRSEPWLLGGLDCSGMSSPDLRSHTCWSEGLRLLPSGTSVTPLMSACSCSVLNPGSDICCRRTCKMRRINLACAERQ